MKKVAHLIISFTLIIFINACAGYEPIFSTSNLQFKITDYSIEGNKKLGNQIYSNLYNLAKSNNNNTNIKSIFIKIKVLDSKVATSKDSAGKILGYKINLNTNVIVKDYLSNEEILNYNYATSSTYKVRDQYSETIKAKNKSINNLINRTYQDLLIKFAENIGKK